MIEEFATSSMQLVSSLSNIKSIISHFNGKIETFRLANQSNALTEQEVMDIVRTNYDTLTLKLQEGLDMFDTYDANLPNEREFMRKHIIDSILDQIKDKLAAQIEQLPNVQNDLQSFVLQTP